MNSHDYIPQSDGNFLEWVKFLFAYVLEHITDWGFNATVVTPITPLIDAFETAYARAKDPNRGKADVVAKNAARDTLKKATRQFVKEYLAYNSLVSDEEREHMALPIHDTKPTPVPPPAERPDVGIDFSQSEEHIIKVTGSPRPANAHGFELWRKVGAPAPETSKDFTYAGFSTKSPFIVKYEFEDKGKIVYYRAHWVNAKNEPGPWSELVSATIA